jgi:hypothetical protein
VGGRSKGSGRDKRGGSSSMGESGLDVSVGGLPGACSIEGLTHKGGGDEGLRDRKA